MIFQNCPKYHEPLENFEILRVGIIAKYYVQVMLLFVYNRSREIFGNAQETFLFKPGFHIVTSDVILYAILMTFSLYGTPPDRKFPCSSNKLTNFILR